MMKFRFSSIHRLGWLLLLCCLPYLSGKAAPVEFETEILPLLEKNCFDCHGPDKQKSELRVDRRAILRKGGDSGLPALVPGDPKGSYLIEVITESDPDKRMPPKGGPLTKEQIALFERWIIEGAEWPGQMDTEHEETTDLWSFQPVIRPDVPKSGKSPIDAFLNAKLSATGLTPNPAADSRSLIRRAAITLTGLPPTPERVESFLQQGKIDPEVAYATLIDELIASPHFGERWGQHWLDVIRWAETNGSEANLYRKNAWVYRDYVIRAFNEDLPYDQFIKEQLAGDQLGAGEATGFLVAGPHVPAATVGREPTAIRQARADRIDEIMQTIGASILGVTVGCARCHNHKFDPISIQDYYAMTAVFQGVEFGGRDPELSEDDPRQKRATAILKEMNRERATLREGVGQWEEDWGGFTELQFPATRTSVLRIEFDRSAVTIDEIEVYGPADSAKNLALASSGTKLVEDEAMAGPVSTVVKANDGAYSTLVWKAKAPEGSKEKPWVEVHFPTEREVNRFRLSTNRDLYFETDYLEQKAGNGFTGYRISALQADGSWKEVGKTSWARELLKRNPEMKQSAGRLQHLIQEISEEGPRHSFIARFEKPVVTHVFHRGSPETPRGEVMPAGLEVLEGDLGLDSSTPEAKRRLEFANWVIRPENPLTARVMVNRLWHHLFGAGIVPTGSDFGFAGAPPSHPELFDWLAAEFVSPSQSQVAPWSMKAMIRMLVMSDAFRRSSHPNEVSLKADAGSALLWRYSPRRAEAEVIRDGILQASGKLDPKLGGRSFRIHNVKKTYAQWEVIDNHGPATWRRMIYQERMRRVDDHIFTAFDFPDCGQVTPTRPVSTTPLQALNLMNSDFVVEQSELIAERAKQEVGDDADARVRRVFALLLTREPDAEELAACQGIDLSLICRSLLNSNEYAFLP